MKRTLFFVQSKSNNTEQEILTSLSGALDVLVEKKLVKPLEIEGNSCESRLAVTDLGKAVFKGKMYMINLMSNQYESS